MGNVADSGDQELEELAFFECDVCGKATRVGVVVHIDAGLERAQAAGVLPKGAR